MKILMVHKFHYIEGGAERYVFNITDLLKRKGHTVIPFAMEDERNFPSDYSDYFVSRFGPDQLYETRNPLQRLKIASRIIYNHEAQEKLAKLIEATRPDIAHVHSIYHHLSPSVLPVLKEHNLPVLMTLHDYKLVCPNYIFLDGKRHVCEACRGKHFWKAVAKKCFRDSFGGSALVAAEAYFNYWRKSYRNNVDLFVSPSQFLADKIKQYGYGHKQVVVQPYTLDISSYYPSWEPSDYFVFMGRLTHEKGLHFLFDAMKHIKKADLYVLGTGPLQPALEKRILDENLNNIKMLGYKSGEELKKIVSHAKFTVVTSEWHDNSPLVIYESLALGNPVIGTRMGGIPELIHEGVDGYTFDRGDMSTFVKRVNQLIDNPEQVIAMGRKGREKAENLYDFDRHYAKLMGLYDLTKSIAKG